MNLVIKTIVGAAFALLAAGSFAAVDINRASQAELESIKGIGPSLAQRILDARKSGTFKDWMDLQSRVKGVRAANSARFSADGLTVGGAAFNAPAVTAAPTRAAKAPKAAKAGKAERVK
ncbi:MAG TPA: helix-hairpin-helix domain-containing protein [Burkholderiaceae bacterium]|nr:helix-hairpin-helix domain-containing protein [Burkholderiaceae bacterium]